MAPQKEEFERRAKAREIQRLEAQREHQAAATAQLEEHRLATLKVFEIKEARLQKWQANEAARYQVCRAGLEPRTSRPDEQAGVTAGLTGRDVSRDGLQAGALFVCNSRVRSLAWTGADTELTRLGAGRGQAAADGLHQLGREATHRRREGAREAARRRAAQRASRGGEGARVRDQATENGDETGPTDDGAAVRQPNLTLAFLERAVLTLQ